MTYLLWAVFVMVQSAANTFTSRARNSGSYALHGIAARVSAMIWIAQQFVGLTIILDAIKQIHGGHYLVPVAIVLGYSEVSAFGAVVMHYIQRTYIEKGNRKVGA